MHSLSSPYEDPNNYRVIRKICPSCGESSLVKKERKPISHGFNPYSRAKSSSTDAKKESLENPSNAKERKESNDKLFTKVVPRSKSMAANSPHFRKKNEGTKSDHEKHHESNKFRSNERSKTDVPLPAREGKHQQKDDLRQRQKSQDHDNKLHKQKSQGNSGGHHRDRREELHNQKSKYALRKEGKDDSFPKHKISGDGKEDGVLKKSLSEKVKQQNKSLRADDKRDGEHKDRGLMHNDKNINAQSNEVHLQSKDGSHDKEDKYQSKSDAHPDMKLKRKPSAQNPHHTTIAPTSSKCTDETPTVGASKSSREDGGSNKHAKEQPSKDNWKLSKLPLENCQATDAKESQNNVEKKVKIDRHEGKKVTIRRPARRIRSLSPPRQIIRKTSIPVATREKLSEENAHRKALKERSKSVGNSGLRQRLDCGLQYIHEKPVSHVPKATLSSYRSEFYNDVMAQSCLQSLMHKNLQI